MIPTETAVEQLVDHSLRNESRAEDGLIQVSLLHRAHSGTQADIWLVNWRGGQCVLRDYSGRRRWPSRLLCRWAVRREIRAHELLDGILGIPRLLAVLDSDRYLIEYVDGAPLNNRSHSPGEEFFEELDRIVADMHSRRVAHGDFRNKNVLVSAEGSPFIIDFSTAWWGTSWWRMPLFEFYKKLDLRRVALARAKFFPDFLEQNELARLSRGPFYIRIGRIYRHFIYRGLSPRHRARRARGN